MSEPAQVFRFKPALLVGARDYHLYTDRLEVWHKDDLEDSVAYTDIQSARFAETSAREYKFRRIDLFTGAKKPHRIHVTSSIASNRNNDPDVRSFYGFVGALSTQLSLIHPEMSVTFGETQKATWIMFLIGLSAILTSAGMLALAIVTNVPDYKLKNAMTPFGVLFLFGIYICSASNPWKPKSRLTWDGIGELTRTL